MPAKNIAPTKTSLLKVKQELKFAKLGYELLDQKKDILVNELLHLVDQAIKFQEKVETNLANAYRDFEKAVLDMGKLKVISLASAINIEAKINLKQRKVMGVTIPVVHTEFIDNPPYYSLQNTSMWIDNALIEFKQALQLMGNLAELKVSIMRLAVEVKKTIRKVNALEKIAIPDLTQTVDYIQSRLEENEREMFILMKLIKSRLTEKNK